VTWGYLLEALLEAGFPALIVLVTLLYAPYFSDYMIPKMAAIHEPRRLMRRTSSQIWTSS
jgi:hypothetical protein